MDKTLIMATRIRFLALAPMELSSEESAKTFDVEEVTLLN